MVDWWFYHLIPTTATAETENRRNAKFLGAFGPLLFAVPTTDPITGIRDRGARYKWVAYLFLGA
jgi:hypothetical protein